MPWKSNRPRMFTSWSFSRYNDWAECPARAAWSHLDKLDRGLPKGEALQRGAFLDERTTEFLTGKVKKMDSDLFPAKAELTRMAKAKNKIVQSDWGYDEKWNPVSTTDWDRCKLRIKIDFGEIVGTHLTITDNKTGKYRKEQNDKYELQLDLYVAGAFPQLPAIKTASARLLYTDWGLVFPDADDMETYTAADAAKLRKDWDRRVKPMLTATKFPARPGHYCRWCNFRKNGPLGGPCKY